MMHSAAPQMAPFPELGSSSSDIGVDVCHITTDNCFQYLSDKQE